VEIAQNNIVKSDFGKRRELFLFIDSPNFSKDKIADVFSYFARKFPDPEWFSITLFSDRAMLRRAMDMSGLKFTIDWTDTPEGRRAAAYWSSKYEPLPTGYFRANYFRIRRFNPTHIEEWFSYSPDANEPVEERSCFKRTLVRAPNLND
jgi:hypothetical protein